MNDLTVAIVEVFKKLGNGVSYVDLSKIDGFTGDMWHGSEEYNQFFWFSCSDEAIKALQSLLNSQTITIRPLKGRSDSVDHLLISIFHGKQPKFPITSGSPNKKYKEPHWIPVVFDKGPKFRDWQPS